MGVDSTKTAGVQAPESAEWQADPATAGTPGTPEAGGGKGTGRKKRKFEFPSAFTVLAALTGIVWILTFVIPSGKYQLDENGSSIPGTYEAVTNDASIMDRVKDLFLAPINGLYGLVTDGGHITPGGSGELFGAASVFLFILAIGAFITVTMRTGALDIGIARVAHRLRNRSSLMIAVLMVIFSLGGTTYGMAEETIGFYALLIALTLKLGYDRMVGAAIIIVGSGIGVMASTVNPFATGVASDAAGISVGDGIVLRLIMWVVLTAIGIAYVTRYAKRVKADPKRSISGFLPEDEAIRAAANDEVPEMTRRHKLIMWVFGATFLVMIYSVIPWSEIGVPIPTWGWYFPELAALFLIGSIAVGLIGKMKEKELVDSIMAGCADFISVALVIVLARGITVIMQNGMITDTILNSLEGLVTGTSSGVFAVMMYAVNVPLSILVPSTSGLAALGMPIFAPLADFAGVDRSLVVTAYTAACGWVNLITPTSAVIMGGVVALGKIRYDRYVKFMLPLMGILFVASLGMVVLGAMLL
jgi:uncharacterized ion transporter superfamily protein YfcC